MQLDSAYSLPVVSDQIFSLFVSSGDTITKCDHVATNSHMYERCPNAICGIQYDERLWERVARTERNQFAMVFVLTS